MSLYNDDLHKDQILSAYLNEKYKALGYNFNRVDDLTPQHQGIDIILHDNGKEILVDEKSQMHYLNRSLPTFAFEIGYLKKGRHHKGWFFDEEKITEVYFLVVHIYTDGKPLESPAQIKSCKILRIGRQRLINTLARLGIDAETCYQHEHHARENDLYGRITIGNEKRFSFNHTRHLDESPFNLVIKLDMLATIGRWL